MPFNNSGLQTTCCWPSQMSYVARIPVIGVSDMVQHKLSCTAIEDGLRLKISELGKEGLYYLCCENTGADQLCGYENTGADQLCGYCTADFCLCFSICKN